MKQPYDLVSLGESLIDFTPAGVNELGMQLFSRNPGGAPANVLAMYAKLGGTTAFIGKVGQDAFGRFLLETMQSAGIDVSGVRQDAHVPTTLAFVQLDAAGERSFSFYRKPGADVMLQPSEVSTALVGGCSVFHFGGVSLTDEPCRSATLEAAKAARAAGALISYDPNYRPFLWPQKAQAAEQLRAALPLADLVKVSQEEMTLLTGETSLPAGAKALCEQGPAVAVITLGPKGAFYHTAQGGELLATYAAATVDTTGAGDAFWGALLWKLAHTYGCCTREALGRLPMEHWHAAVQYANAAGSLTTTKKGAIPAMPTRQEIEACVERGRMM